jgi:hypothetical protein
MTLNFSVTAQTDNDPYANISEAYKRDSIKMENTIEFYKYSDHDTPATDAVRFKLTITNLGHQPIPNLMKVSNRTKHLKLFYNNKDSNDLNICNGTEADNSPSTLQKGESDTFETGYVFGLLDDNSGIFLWGNPVTVLWKYLNYESSKETVDLKKKKILKN